MAQWVINTFFQNVHEYNILKIFKLLLSVILKVQIILK